MLYAAATALRNWLYDHGWLTEHSTDVRTVCVGNLAVGGTGKTPHTAFIARRLRSEGLSVAILSRGYGRATHGYREVSAESRASEVGDEPLQLFRDLCGGGEKPVTVAVCEDRVEGVNRLAERHAPDVVVLDDAFQHRRLRPTERILLTDYARPYCADRQLPWGRLRESARGARRADVIIVTKCPPGLTRDEADALRRRLKPEPRQRVLFSSVAYAPLEFDETLSAAVVTAIARPEPLLDHLRALGVTITTHLRYADHHRFTEADARRIDEAARRADVVITTAKDAVRLDEAPLAPDTRSKLRVQHITVRFLFGESLFTDGARLT